MKLFSIFSPRLLWVCELYRPEDAEDLQLLFVRSPLWRDAEPVNGVVSRRNNTPLYFRTLLRERTYQFCPLLVRHLLTRGFQTLLGGVSDLSTVAFQGLEWDFKLPAADPYAKHYHSVFSSGVGVSTFQICLQMQQVITFPRLPKVNFPEIDAT